MLKVGITGGIGSGKSTVCQIFTQLGIPVYDADQRAKALMTTDQSLVLAIKALLGEEAYGPDKQLNRQRVTQIVFNAPEKLAQLNALVHPAVARDSQQWHEQQQSVPYTLKEAALLFEAGSYQSLDKIICVVAPEALRIDRVMARDQSNREAVEARIAQQWPQARKARLSDYLVYNDGSRSLLQQVLFIHQQLKQQAQS